MNICRSSDTTCGTADMGLESSNQNFGFASECDHEQVTLSPCNLCFVTRALFYIPASGFSMSPKMSAQF